MKSNVPLIGLTGFKGVGKDTVAKHLRAMYGFERRAFADKMKEAVANLFGVPIESIDEWKMDGESAVTIDWSRGQKFYTGREFLQRFGTEMGRNTFGKDFWVNLAMSEPMYKPTVFTDCRFENEMRAIKERGGKIVYITRPGYESDGHASEQSPPVYMIDHWLHNDGDDLHLFRVIEEMMYDLYAMQLEGV